MLGHANGIGVFGMSKLKIIKVRRRDFDGPIQTDKQRKAYEEFAKQKVGLKPSDEKKLMFDYNFAPLGKDLHEFVWNEECLYERFPDDGIFFHTMFKAPDYIPDVLCPCGCSEFRLKYREYAIDGICKQCGKRDVIYSG